MNSTASTGTQAALRRCLILYILLLLFEGVLRKWVLPQFSAPLLLIRDPVALYALVLGWQLGVLRRSVGLQWFGLLTVLTALASLAAFLLEGQLPPLLYLVGLRTYFLHLPLIWLFPVAFNRLAVEAIGVWLMRLGPPMAGLMVAQYFSDKSAWINLGAGGGGQIGANIGLKIRAAATFSYNTGAGYFFALVLAFALAHTLMQVGRRIDFLALASVVVCASVSLSRTTVLLLVVAAVLPLLSLKRPLASLTALVARQSVAVLLLVLVLAVTPVGSIVAEGFSNFQTRRTSAASGGDTVLYRSLILFDIQQPLFSAPLLGRGIGLGTQSGAQLVSGKNTFLLEEWDWPRHVSELGPIFGVAYIGLRLAITIWLLRVALRCRTTGDLLPFCLWSVLLPILPAGNLAVPTHIGFVVVLGGLLLAAARYPALPYRAHPQDN